MATCGLLPVGLKVLFYYFNGPTFLSHNGIFDTSYESIYKEEKYIYMYMIQTISFFFF